MHEVKNQKNHHPMKNSLLQNRHLSELRNTSIDSLTHTAKVAIATKLKTTSDTFQHSKEKKKVNTAKFYTGASQEEIPVKTIKNGIVITDDNRYIGIVEVLPINYDIKSTMEKSYVINSYKELFHNGPCKLQVKVMSDTLNPAALIDNIKKNCKNQSNPQIKAALDDYFTYIQILSSYNSVYKRFFIIFEYDGNGFGQKAASLDEIISTMAETRDHIKNIMKDCGNVCIYPDNETLFVSEFLYYFFNRKTSKKESFEDRYHRIESDFQQFNTATNKDKEFTYPDLFAPKGLHFINRDYIFWDGYYYGYIGIDGNSWPESAYWAWTQQVFNFGANVDVDYIYKRNPKELTMISLKNLNALTSENLKDSIKREHKGRAEQASKKLSNNNFVYQNMKAGDDLFDCAIILTIREETPSQLSATKRKIEKELTKSYFSFNSSYLFCEDYFRMTMPFLYLTPIFQELKHNILTSAAKAMYPCISYQLYDPTGIVLGLHNGSVVAINNFNTLLYKNANILLLGTTGSGKTFTEQLIGRRSLLSGIKCFFLIPKKGYEYKKGCELVGGTYIKLVPGSKDCINIMEIRPEGKLNKDLLDEDAEIDNNCYLAKKINNIIIWLQLLLGKEELSIDEYNDLNVALVNVYDSFGITMDNTSIFNSKTGDIKEMPILQDLYEETKKYQSLARITKILDPFIYGNCSNMNGQTNVDLDNDYIVYDIDEDLIGKKLLPSFLYIGFENIYSAVKEDIYSKKIINLDEVWKMTETDDCSDQVRNAVKIVRGYYASVIIGTQELKDFLNNSKATSVLSTTEIKIFLNMQDEDLEKAKNIFHLTASDYELIKKFHRGEGLFVTNRDKLTIQIIATQQEFDAFNTDGNYRKR